MTQPIQFFELASKQAEWLSVRQSVVAGNIANANTPGYKAKDVTPFQSVLENTGIRMAATSPMHFTEGSLASEITDVEANDDVGIQISGNSVGLAEELMKQGQVKREYELSAGLVKAFHRMMLMTVRT
ncbi:flagellar basal body rod protein FlgB [Rhizobium sp. TRM96647]|uniref:flagellar basal body rod protein FlgB n=1 Tax=unclassified Rhizobium TaxID=2613769 RepID=UPI0021E7B7B9|nr:MULTISPECIES: flagellar basal body rod protein FlgB [unclassified Rhizobium]MCV3737145.1 flagellar basal body rod protein FlgB [Rhizobium sp. TRM96647]MCV3759129.1 flagellar basal body rod protein FlgB [Rhizobium sp. TRM96650]